MRPIRPVDEVTVVKGCTHRFWEGRKVPLRAPPRRMEEDGCLVVMASTAAPWLPPQISLACPLNWQLLFTSYATTVPLCV
jgi:hypothetical protein